MDFLVFFHIAIYLIYYPNLLFDENCQLFIMRNLKSVLSAKNHKLNNILHMLFAVKRARSQAFNYEFKHSRMQA